MTIDGPQFSWDPSKDKLNRINHGISFYEAKTVFYDEMAKIIDDPDHSQYEDRFIILGISNNLRVLIVCHCYRSDDDEIRIISARKATKNEIKTYTGE